MLILYLKGEGACTVGAVRLSCCLLRIYMPAIDRSNDDCSIYMPAIDRSNDDCRYKYTGPFNGLAAMARIEGIRSWYIGADASAVRVSTAKNGFASTAKNGFDGPFFVLFFTILGDLKVQFGGK